MSRDGVAVGAAIPLAREAGTSPVRAGGLVTIGRGKVAPVFAVALTLLYVDVALLLVAPWLIAAPTQGFFASTTWLSFAALATFTALVFGLFSAITAERRGKSAWWFHSGHAAIFAAPVLGGLGLVERDPRLALALTIATGLVGAGAGLLALPPDKPEGRPIAAVGPLLTRLCGFWYRSGNIWIGMTLLVTLMITLGLGVRWEDIYGTKSAHHNVYGGPWFGIVFLAFSASLIAATVRKYPWRVDQTGWIVVHIALVLLIVGAFMTYWGKVEGSLSLLEGEARATFQLATDSELVVEEFSSPAGGPRWRPVWTSEIKADVDPKVREPKEVLPVQIDGDTLFTIAIDRYYGTAKEGAIQVGEAAPPAPGELPHRALQVQVKAPGGEEARTITLVTDGERDLQRLGGFLTLILTETSSERRIAALTGGRDQDLNERGRLLVRERLADGSTRDLGALPVRLARDGAEGPYRPVPEASRLRLEAAGLTLQIDHWFDVARAGPNGQPIDAAPGVPLRPIAMVSLQKDDGQRENRIVEVFEQSAELQAMQGKVFPQIEVELDYIPKLPLQAGSVSFMRLTGGELHWAMERSDGLRDHGVVKIGAALPLGIPLTITPSAWFDAYGREWLDWEFGDYGVGTTEALRLSLSEEAVDEVPHHWLLINSDELAATQGFKVGDRTFRVRWRRPDHPLGFRLHLREFHRDYYPGSNSASSYESYLWLRHPEKFPDDTGIKIDMNNPLRLDGWRLYQARFNASPQIEGTVLQVNRDPGLGMTYFACAVLTLGLVIVFFQKPFMRAWHRRLKAENASGQRMFLAALAVPVMAVLSTLPGILLIATTPESPLLGIAIPLIMAGLAAETAFANTVLKRRFEAPSQTLRTPVRAET